MFHITKNIILFTSFSTYLFASPMNFIKIENPDGTELKFKVTKNTNHFFDDILAEERALQNAIRAKKTASTSNIKYASRDNGDSKEIIQEAKNHLGGRYVWGGTRPSGFDCSGYVQYLYKKEGVNLPRTAMAQSQVGKDVTTDELQKGDLLFFKTTDTRNIPITHVGIYMGANKFIHAASKKLGIIVSELEGGRYESKLVKAKRVI
ncbi:MAG: NlpC/P60 family protein [Sulfurovum sp.]|nr:MAG: NlpC/P60 family protein [Sulfurovum sp.]